MQRIRAGLTGLACVFLIVVLAAAFLNMARTDDATGNVVLANGTVTNTSAVDETPRDPLAELGVAPDAAVTEPEKTPPPAQPTPPKR